MKGFMSCVLIWLVATSSAAFAGAACDVLETGNKHYSSREYTKALDVYKTIEDIDKIGKEECTPSVYATIATIYTTFGDQQLGSNAKKAALYYKTASKYNRAFANAVICNTKNCDYSTQFWNENK